MTFSIEGLGGRKFLLAQEVLVSTFLLAMLGKLTAEFAGVAAIVYGGYATSNAMVTKAALKSGPDADA